jgi:decaprenylphospho-beta-D-ribofuranose 2-oxidase
MLSGWGRFPQLPCAVHSPRTQGELVALVQTGPLIGRGNGRGYGDCALNQANTVDMRRFNRMLAFDQTSGQLIAEAGVLLADVISTFLPRGWFPAVTPGTKFVTIGGMVAADVHGKNHHRDGSFAACVDWIDILTADGSVHRCSRDADAELFGWTLGGMGLTGLIVRVAFRLRAVETGWIRQSTLIAPDLAATMALFEHHANANYSVAWIDCLAGKSRLGRSVVTLGEHAAADDLPASRRARPFETPRRPARTVPFAPPVSPINSLTIKAFNTAYWHAKRLQQGEGLVDWDSFFYPLDALRNWNRMYGKRGFMQFQCVIPLAEAKAGLTRLLEAIGHSGQGSFLAVLKRFGVGSGPASFPMEGYTLALDFPVSSRNSALLDRLDRIVLDHKGRFYLAKDSRMTADTLHSSDARMATLQAMRAASGAARFQSSQSQRLAL